MAAVSTKLGQAAAELSANTPKPASLVPEDPNKSVVEKAETAIINSGMSTASPLDMPPAVVGPLSLRLAAANGDPSAQFDVGARLAEGKGKTPDFKEAAKWYQRSADQGFAQSQYRLGTLYERGLGLKTDAARALFWYEKAATAGNIKAMHNLAVMSANQSGSSPDYESASRWFTEAAERGLADSQFNLAVLHENGLGVEKDLKQAYKWLSLAARSGDGEAVKRRDILQGKLSAAEVAEAEKLVGAWRKQDVDKLTNDVRAAADAWKKNPKNGVNG
jgi:localization factor PodJL